MYESMQLCIIIHVVYTCTCTYTCICTLTCIILLSVLGSVPHFPPGMFEWHPCHMHYWLDRMSSPIDTHVYTFRVDIPASQYIDVHVHVHSAHVYTYIIT